MQITVSIKSVYGNVLIYPVSENAKLLARLTGKKTITRDALATIKKLGYEIEVQAPGLDA
jgi:hypothetical protein